MGGWAPSSPQVPSASTQARARAPAQVRVRAQVEVEVVAQVQARAQAQARVQALALALALARADPHQTFHSKAASIPLAESPETAWTPEMTKAEWGVWQRQRVCVQCQRVCATPGGEGCRSPDESSTLEVALVPHQHNDGGGVPLLGSLNSRNGLGQG